MKRISFCLLMALHGLIHLMGFLKAFNIAEMKALTQPISQFLGVLWLLTTLLMLDAAIHYIAKKKFWFMPALLGSLLSQVLIILTWQDAKFGTVPNIIILAAAIISIAEYVFDKKFACDAAALLRDLPESSKDVLTKKSIAHLPVPVQRWMEKAGVLGRKPIRTVYLKQKAFLRMKPEQTAWFPGDAEQYFTIEKPAFAWKVKMMMMSVLPVSGKDIYKNGTGEMLIKILSLFKAVDSGGKKMDESTLLRYLAEICWFPTAALQPYISWESIDDLTAKATMSYKGSAGSVTFYFNEAGEVVKQSAMRYMGNGENDERKEWTILIDENAVMAGFKIPVKMRVHWKLETGDWNWAKMELTEIRYE